MAGGHLGWLALMAPRPAYVPVLRSVRVRHPGNDWATRCALTCIQGKPWPSDLQPLHALVRQSQQLLQEVSVRPLPLRKLPTGEVAKLLEAERQAIRHIYATDGLDAARKRLQRSRLRDWIIPYPQWLREQGNH